MLPLPSWNALALRSAGPFVFWVECVSQDAGGVARVTRWCGFLCGAADGLRALDLANRRGAERKGSMHTAVKKNGRPGVGLIRSALAMVPDGFADSPER